MAARMMTCPYPDRFCSQRSDNRCKHAIPHEENDDCTYRRCVPVKVPMLICPSKTCNLVREGKGEACRHAVPHVVNDACKTFKCVPVPDAAPVTAPVPVPAPAPAPVAPTPTPVPPKVEKKRPSSKLNRKTQMYRCSAAIKGFCKIETCRHFHKHVVLEMKEAKPSNDHDTAICTDFGKCTQNAGKALNIHCVKVRA